MKNSVQSFDNEFKLIIVGSSGVGKSAILIRYADDKFSDDLLRPTIGVDFRFKTLTIDNKRVKIQIWDTAGQQGFRTIVSAYYKGADAIIVVYDQGDMGSLKDVEEFWAGEIEENREEGCVVMLLGNKSDLGVGRGAEGQRRIEAVKRKLGAELYFGVSAKEGEGVEHAFGELCRELVKRNSGGGRRKGGGVRIGKGEETEEGEERKVNGGCCK